MLIIDDAEQLTGQKTEQQIALEQTLEESGLTPEVFRVNNLSAAITELKHYPFSCILLNKPSKLDMPQQLLHELQLSGQSIPIVAIIDDAKIDDAKTGVSNQWQQVGVKEVLRQSTLTPDLLIQTLKYVVQLHQVEQKAKFSAQRLRQTDQNLKRQYEILEQQEQQIKQLHLELAKSTQLKNQFLAIVSHELRTPMNAIIGFSQLLQRSPALRNSRQVKMVDQILANAKQLLAMIDQILTFSRIEAGHLAIQRRPLNLVHLTRAVATELQVISAQKNLTLTVQCDLSTPQIVTDPTGLQQVLVTLISNAIKFTASGEIKVIVEELEPDRLRITVRDTGIGIEPTDLEHIFEPFRQVDQSTTRHFEGLGLGLAITAALVQQLQGSITVTSTPNQGSEFRVDLPRQMTDPTLSKRKIAQVSVQ